MYLRQFVLAAVQCLWALSFDENVQEKILADDDVMDSLLQLRSSPETHIAQASNGALWAMRSKLKDSKKFRELGT